MEKNEKILVLSRVAQQHSSVVMESARALCEKLAMMHERIPSLKNPDGKKALKYFSKLYDECVPIVVSITYYVVENKLAGKKKIYDNLTRAQKILEYLKMLDFRYKLKSLNSRSKKKPSEWYSYSPLENSEIIEKLDELIKGVSRTLTTRVSCLSRDFFVNYYNGKDRTYY